MMKCDVLMFVVMFVKDARTLKSEEEIENVGEGDRMPGYVS